MMTIMDSVPVTLPSGLLRIERLPQAVPSCVCLNCEVCCRFPEADSFLRPYFTAEEIAQAITGGVDPSAFPDPCGSQIRVVRHPQGDGYICPAFDAVTSHCRIYDVRPLDCRIYPLAVMWSADERDVVLGWDQKCPYMMDPRSGAGGGAFQTDSTPIEVHVDHVANILEEDPIRTIYYHYPRLIGRYQDDVVVMRALPRLTAEIAARSAPSNPIKPVNASPSGLGEVRPLTPNDYPRFQQALAEKHVRLAAYGLPTHVIWQKLFNYFWSECDEHLCLFAEYADGIFMPLPPLGSGSVARSLEKAWAFMRKRNRATSVSRVENVPVEWKQQWESWGYRLASKDSDYVYQARALAELRGDRYKSPRAACNRFERTHRYRYAPYQAHDREACLDLYGRWALQKKQNTDSVAALMLTDALSAHSEAMIQWEALGLMGRVVWIDDRPAAYSFGYFQSPALFSTILEVSDRSFPGLASWIFREVCREAYKLGAAFINTMDDSGMTTLARSKQSYHPVQIIPNFIATEAERFD